jgi:hypothetical protein
MAYKMPIEPQHPTILHPWGCPCSMAIEGDFVPKDLNNLIVHHKIQILNTKSIRYS